MSETPPQPNPKRAPKPERPAHLPHGRWLGDLGDLSPFENRLVAACARGEECEPDDWDGERPEADAATKANTVRAEIIRFLALGGDDDHPVHEEGVMLGGGWITGVLSLHQATASVRLDLKFCHFDSEPVFVAANLPELALVGSKVPSLRADGMVVKGGVFLSGSFEANGEVGLIGAQIGGDLTCANGKFSNPEGNALNADRMVVKGSVFLRDGFEASGEVRLLGAQIGGNLECDNGKFSSVEGGALSADSALIRGNVFLRNGFEASGPVGLIGAQIDGDLDCRQGTFSHPMERVFYADRMFVKGSVFLLETAVNGAIIFNTAQIGTLNDDLTCWQAGGHLLDGLHYDRIIGPTDAKMRIGWLEKQRNDHLTTDFKPQPWEQLIKVLRDMGHPYDAAQVAIAKQKQLRKAGKIQGPTPKALHWLYGFLAGYGYQPMKLVFAMIWLWLGCAFFFSVGSDYGYIGPSTPLLNNPELALSIDESCGHRREAGKQVWTKCANMPAEYTTFQPLLYSLDLILPLVDLQQESDWAPIVEEAPGVNMGYGVFLRWLMWFEILFGWMASLMLVAILGRLVDKD